MSHIKVYDDFDRLHQVFSDEQRRKAKRYSARFGKAKYALAYPQAVQWKRDPVPLKMLVIYLAAADYLVPLGVPRNLADLAATLGNINGRPLTPKLHANVMFIAAPWHIRARRVFKLLLNEFQNNNNVESYGAASGIIEILALIASGNHTATLHLMDNDPIAIDLAKKLIMLFRDNGYDVSDQVSVSLGEIHGYSPRSDTHTIASIGLLHNYIPFRAANSLTQSYFDAGVKRVITDIYYDAEKVDSECNDAKLRTTFVKDVLDWNFGPPDGLLLCSKNVFDDFSDKEIELYNHSLNATVVISQPEG